MRSTYKIKRFEARLVLRRKAIDVLYEKMMFYRDKSDDLHKKVIDTLYERGSAALLVDYKKAMHKYNAMVLECARALAPYQSHRLESVKIEKNVTHKFVIKAPMPTIDPQHWLAQADHVLKELPPPPKFIEKGEAGEDKYSNSYEEAPLERKDNFIDMNAA